ncbi:transmembrane protein, putative [Medicago truncatula]|uniref:Transmembrane protein, putative n=1 Tax=Medicago truncatula TaxID=3880 RepID=A0A072TQC9_MEDTR|nr:transmembrane protein, putative [Medicago truncatula]
MDCWKYLLSDLFLFLSGCTLKHFPGCYNSGKIMDGFVWLDDFGSFRLLCTNLLVTVFGVMFPFYQIDLDMELSFQVDMEHKNSSKLNLNKYMYQQQEENAAQKQKKKKKLECLESKTEPATTGIVLGQKTPSNRINSAATEPRSLKHALATLKYTPIWGL